MRVHKSILTNLNKLSLLINNEAVHNAKCYPGLSDSVNRLPRHGKLGATSETNIFQTKTNMNDTDMRIT